MNVPESLQKRFEAELDNITFLLKLLRRQYENRKLTQLALVTMLKSIHELHNTIHSIATDDPEGIEAYWLNRFNSPVIAPRR